MVLHIEAAASHGFYCLSDIKQYDPARLHWPFPSVTKMAAVIYNIDGANKTASVTRGGALKSVFHNYCRATLVIKNRKEILQHPTYIRDGAISYLGSGYSSINVYGRKEMFYLMTNSTHFILRLYGVGHMVKDHSDSERGNPLPPHVYSFRLTARVLLYAPSHRQDST